MVYRSHQVRGSLRRSLTDRSPCHTSSRKKALPHVAAFVYSALTTPAQEEEEGGGRKNHLIYYKPPISKPKTRSSFSRRGKVPKTNAINDLVVVPFIKPTSRPSLYPRIPSPWVPISNLTPSRDRERAIFCPRNGREEVGISVRRCLANKLREEVADASESIASLLPAAWRRLIAKTPKGHLVINWSSPTLPRFESPQIEYMFSFVRPDGSLMSVGEFVGQIANIYDFWFRCDFDRIYKNMFSIRADSMRLRELILVDKKEVLWKVEAGY